MEREINLGFVDALKKSAILVLQREQRKAVEQKKKMFQRNQRNKNTAQRG